MAAMLSLPGSAQAGRLLVTGHDADQHCALEGAAPCHFMSTAVNYVKGGAPDAAKPLLVLDRGGLNVPAALNKAFRGAVPAYQVVDPRSSEFASLQLTTAAYSAIIVASSKDDPTDEKPDDLNEFGSTPDTDAINARAADIEAFFNAGGGIFVNSGGQAARANSAKYYRFLRITRGGEANKPPLKLTVTGRAIGFQDARQFPGESNDINCCVTHLSFEAPAPESPLKISEVDRDGKAVTLIAETSQLAKVEEPLANPVSVFSGVPGSSSAGTTGGTSGTTGTTGGGTTGGGTTGGGTTGGTKPGGKKPKAKSVCIPKRGRLRVSLKRPRGVRFARVTVYVNNKSKRTVKGRSLGSKSRTKAFTVILSRTRTSKVLIVATTSSGRKLSFRQTYRRC